MAKINKEENYGKSIKPLLQRMFQIEREKKALIEESKKLKNSIQSLNNYLLSEE